MTSKRTRLLVVRHGDRLDYANAKWRCTAQELGLNVRDPPLSKLGWRQAAETAKQIETKILAKWGRLDAVLVSPYLRVIQTAHPLALRTGAQLKIEEGLSETHHKPGSLPSKAERFAYFPTIDSEYVSMFKVVADGCCFEGDDVESYPIGYMKRMMQVAQVLEQELEGKNVICYTHAASIALVAALLRTELPMDESFKFAPCGIFHLEKEPGGEWKMVSDGFSNSPYVTENSPTTQAWGFDELKIQVWNALLQEDELPRSNL